MLNNDASMRLMESTQKERKEKERTQHSNRLSITRKPYRTQPWLQLQHPPSVKAAYAHETLKLVVRHRGQALHQHVGHLLPSWGVSQLHRSIIDDLSQEVVADVDVFHVVMELRVPGNGDGGLVVDAEDSGGRHVLAKFGQELPQPYGFLGGVGPGDILCLGARERDGGLLLGASADGAASELEHVARG
jgi:hypothetical protein